MKIIGKIVDSFLIKLWWAQVAVSPDLTRIVVFIRGTWKGLKGNTPIGGQIQPNWISGFKLWWKKAQKKPEKNITSEKINHNIPNFKPLETLKVWKPSYTLSRITSRHQKKQQQERKVKAKKKR